MWAWGRTARRTWHERKENGENFNNAKKWQCPVRKHLTQGEKMLEQKCRVIRQMYTITISRWTGGGAQLVKMISPEWKPEEERRGHCGTRYCNTARKIGKYRPKYHVANRRNADTAFRSLYIVHAYLKLHSSSVFIDLKYVCTICPYILVIWVVRWWLASEQAPAEDGIKTGERTSEKLKNSESKVDRNGTLRSVSPRARSHTRRWRSTRAKSLWKFEYYICGKNELNN